MLNKMKKKNKNLQLWIMLMHYTLMMESYSQLPGCMSVFARLLLQSRAIVGAIRCVLYLIFYCAS